MWKFISTQLTSQGLVPGGLVAKTQHSLCSGLTSTSGWKLKSCFKLREAEAPGDQNHQKQPLCPTGAGRGPALVKSTPIIHVAEFEGFFFIFTFLDLQNIKC